MFRRLLYFSIFAFSFLLLTISFTSCEKDIQIKLDPTSTSLVVDGTIENDRYPRIILSRSLDYFGRLDVATLAASFVHGARITVSNGTITGQLLEDSLQNDSTGLVLYFYSFNDIDQGPKFTGAFNTSYQLQIEWQTVTYSATTSIPALNKYIDSLWWVPAPPGVDTGKVDLKARIVDPPGFGNYTRYYTRVNEGLYYPGLNSVFDDQITDGTTYTVTVDQGVNRNFPIDFNEYSFFNRGDSVVVKLANIDQGTFNFWRTMEYNYQSIGNPFSTPTTVISNISNGALGYFGGYAAQYKNLIIPH
jgi:hypothetical protein